MYMDTMFDKTYLWNWSENAVTENDGTVAACSSTTKEAQHSPSAEGLICIPTSMHCGREIRCSSQF